MDSALLNQAASLRPGAGIQRFERYRSPSWCVVVYPVLYLVIYLGIYKALVVFALTRWGERIGSAVWARRRVIRRTMMGVMEGRAGDPR